MKSINLLKFLLLLLCLQLPSLVSAYDFKVNNIAYNIVSSANKTVEVAPKTSSSAGSDGSTNYSGNVVINESVYYSGTNYTVVGIGESAFKNSFISSLKLPETLQYIKKEAFSTCFELEELSIPASVTQIGTSCFWMCPDLIRVYSYAITPPTCTGSNVFSYMAYNNATLYVPHGCLSAYQNAYGWKDFPNFQEMTPSINGHEYVDLQLPSGNLWATTNYGATSPYGYGSYVEWSSNDVVASSWGNEWCTPTINDIKELINNCQWTWTTQNGTNGYLVRGNNGNTIFLPAAGIKMGSVMKVGEWCYYWSSTPESSSMTYILLSTASSVWYGSQNTMASLPIRPISKQTPSVVLATSILLNKSNLNLKVGDIETLVATVEPSNVSNGEVTWNSSNTNIAIVDQNGLVTAKSTGNAVITAMTTDGTNLTATCNVIVTNNETTTRTINIGSNTFLNERLPICNWVMGGYTGSECLYLKDDLVGMKKGDKIYSLSYYLESGNAAGGNFNVRMKNTAINSFKYSDDVFDTSVIELDCNDIVNCNVTLSPYGGGTWIDFVFSEPFVYEGENIIIDIRNTTPGTSRGWCYFHSTEYNGGRRNVVWNKANSENVNDSGFNSYGGIYNDELNYAADVCITYIPVGLPGDVNGDGLVTAADITTLYDILLNNDYSHAVYGDQTGDGIVTAADVTAVYNILLNDNSQLNNETEYTVNGVTFKMVTVEGGSFTMGATAEQGSDAYSDESPTHQVTLSSFSIGQTEVTQELWQAVMGSNPSHFNGGSYGTNLQRPVEKVNWGDCQEFIMKLNQMTGKNFRLPTEAEWEYAARGGNRSQGYKYSGSNNIDDVAWYWDNIPSQSEGTAGYGTQTVATKQPNELGIYDMSGNMLEWCQDWYGNYSADAQTNPTGPASGSYCVRRGGSWYSIARNCRVSNRNYGNPVNCNYALGMRLAL